MVQTAAMLSSGILDMQLPYSDVLNGCQVASVCLTRGLRFAPGRRLGEAWSVGKGNRAFPLRGRGGELKR